MIKSAGKLNSKSTLNDDQSVSSLPSTSSIVRGCGRSRLIMDVIEEKFTSTEAAQDLGKLNKYLSNLLPYLSTCSKILALLKTSTSCKFGSSHEIRNPSSFNKGANVLEIQRLQVNLITSSIFRSIDSLNKYDSTSEFESSSAIVSHCSNLIVQSTSTHYDSQCYIQRQRQVTQLN